MELLEEFTNREYDLISLAPCKAFEDNTEIGDFMVAQDVPPYQSNQCGLPLFPRDLFYCSLQSVG